MCYCPVFVVWSLHIASVQCSVQLLIANLRFFASIEPTLDTVARLHMAGSVAPLFFQCPEFESVGDVRGQTWETPKRSSGKSYVSAPDKAVVMDGLLSLEPGQ